MDNHAGGRQPPSSPRPRGPILGSFTVPGEPERVSRARGFVARVPGVRGAAGRGLGCGYLTDF